MAGYRAPFLVFWFYRLFPDCVTRHFDRFL